MEWVRPKLVAIDFKSNLSNKTTATRTSDATNLIGNLPDFIEIILMVNMIQISCALKRHFAGREFYTINFIRPDISTLNDSGSLSHFMCKTSL